MAQTLFTVLSCERDWLKGACFCLTVFNPTNFKEEIYFHEKPFKAGDKLQYERTDSPQICFTKVEDIKKSTLVSKKTCLRVLGSNFR